MANANNIVVPGERINSKTGAREFDFDQLKIWMTNVGGATINNQNVIITSNATVNAAYTQANAARAQANTALEVAESAYDQANTADDIASAANLTATLAIHLAEGSYQAVLMANAAANLVAVYANDALVIANANLNFNNTSTVNVNVYSSSSANQANIAFNANGTAIVGPTAQTANSALIIASAAVPYAGARTFAFYNE